MAGRRRTSGSAAPCCPAPLVVDGRARFDWRYHRLGDMHPCRVCRGSALMRDCAGKAIHKMCAEREYARDLLDATARNTRQGA
jgi:hypothetical protein